MNSSHAAPLSGKDEPFVRALSAVLDEVLEPDPEGSVLLIGLHRVVIAVMHRSVGHGVPVGTLKRFLRAAGLAVGSADGGNARVYGVQIKPHTPET